MDETYRMLGREHEADLEREALKWQRAAEVRANARGGDRPQHGSPWQSVNDRAPGAIRRLALRLGSIATALRRTGMASTRG
jgi:hypothetical protein